MRIFRRSVLNRISSWYHVRYPILWVDMEYVVGNGVCSEDGPEIVDFQEEGKVASRLELTPSYPCSAKLGQARFQRALGRSLPYERGS